MGSFRWKRGSARDVPPGVYMPFYSASSDEDSASWVWLGWFLVVILGLFFVGGIAVSFLQGIHVMESDDK
jgi:hypothetical protein